MCSFLGPPCSSIVTQCYHPCKPLEIEQNRSPSNLRLFVSMRLSVALIKIDYDYVGYLVRLMKFFVKTKCHPTFVKVLPDSSPHIPQSRTALG